MDGARRWSDKIDRPMATIATGSYNKGSAYAEKNRSEGVLKGMQDVFDKQCKK